MGPALQRELTIAPRRVSFYVARTAYPAALLTLAFAAWMLLTGTQEVRNYGDLALFGRLLAEFLGPLQLVVLTSYAALSATSAVAQEKDQRTFTLLLLSRLSNVELVVGKLAASLVQPLSLLAAGTPVFILFSLLGGVGLDSIAWMTTVTAVSMLIAASLGSTLALWREKTFQALTLTALASVAWLGLWEAAARGALGEEFCGVPASTWGTWFSPWRAIVAASRPLWPAGPDAAWFATSTSPLIGFLVCGAIGVLSLNGVAAWRVREWNTSHEPARRGATDESAPPTRASAARRRVVWNNPVLWREVMTWGYGRKMALLRLSFWGLFALALLAARRVATETPGGAAATQLALIAAPFALLGLVLLNAQAVTSITTERDLGALDLLLVTDLSPREIVYGKLAGVLYNGKELIALPIALYACLAGWRMIGVESAAYLIGGTLVMAAFVAVLGLHMGLAYPSSRGAILASQGVVFFLFVGIAACMRVMVAFSGSFHGQLAPFAAFIGGGAAGLFAALGIRNPSPALLLASILCPFMTFYGLTSYLLDNTLATFLATTATYGFATAAMLIPAVGDFDVTTGRSHE